MNQQSFEFNNPFGYFQDQSIGDLPILQIENQSESLCHHQQNYKHEQKPMIQQENDKQITLLQGPTRVDPPQSNDLSFNHIQRVNNNIFKTSLSSYRKVNMRRLKAFIDEFKNKKIQKKYQQLYRECIKKKNYSSFPKLYILTCHLKLTQQVLSRWLIRIKNMLEKKKQLSEQGKFSSKRYQQLKKSIKSMEQYMKQNDLKVYWGPFKQKYHFNQSKKQVDQFIKKILQIEKQDLKQNQQSSMQ